VEHGLLQGKGKGKGMRSNFRLSVAVPVHNEESVLPELLTRVLGVLDKMEGGPHEYVGRIYEGTKGRPIYVIGRLIGGGNRPDLLFQQRENLSQRDSRR